MSRQNNKKTSAHDALFKALMGRKETVVDFLYAFLPEIARKIDIDKIEITNKSFVSEKLKEHFSDLVVKTTTKNNNTFIVFLYEHKSSKDKYLYHQIAGYVWDIEDFFRKQNLKLPVIIPIVFYHGKEKFIFPNFEELYGVVDNIFSEFIPKYKILFFDLFTYGEKYISKARNNLALMILIGLLSNIFKSDQAMFDFLDFIKRNHKGALNSHVEILEIVLTYLGKFRKFANEPQKQKIMDTLLQNIDYEPGSMIDQWVQQGIRQGIQQGIQQEKLEEEKRLKRAVKKMLEKNFDDDLIMDLLEISEEKLSEIKRKLQ